MTTIGMSAGQKMLSTVTGGALGAYPAYGLAMRFSVTVDGLSLGLWRSCKGLNVEMKYKVIEEGGAYLGDIALPERLVYGRVSLERAVEKTSSQELQAWLKGYIYQWYSYPLNEKGTPPATDVVITLLDYQLNQVMQWTLSEARPVKWAGPGMQATDNNVAIETLEFDHEGFL
ncbi:MAG TPA: phage tail protein [Streptosporangiaceae bacterium]|jgi:phage tail-like protein|nr:phage tail protein [Streptosporangiaceae bacterium]